MMVMQPSSAPMYTPSIFQPSYTPRYIQSDAQDHAKADVDNDSDSDNDDNGVGEEQRLDQASSSSSSQQQQQQRPREERPLSPASIASSHEEEEDNDDDAQSPYDDFMTSSAPIYIRRNVVEEDEADGVDPSFHSRTSWRGSSSMDNIPSKTSPTRPEFSRFYTDTSALVRVVRPRSHFSIPDVVVTSCEEEGQEEYFEMKVEPTRRKLSLPTTLKQLEAEREASEERRLLEAAASSAVLPGPPAQIISATKQSRQGAKMSTSIFKTKSKPAPIRVVQERSQTVDSEKQQFPSDVSTPTTVSSASTSLPEKATFAKRMRKSSLSNLFSKKEKDAQLPPSPTIPVEWQATAGSLLEERLKQQRHQQGDSPLQSPTAYSSMDSALPSPTSPTSPGIANEQMVKRSPTKKELKAKEKQEKALIKEREKVDKMVRKHDKMVQKALLKKASKDSTSSANKSDKESVSASSSSSSSSSIQKIAASRERMRKSAADIKAMKAADFCARHVSPPRPTMSHDEVPLPSMRRREDSASPNNGTVSILKGTASQVQKKAVREQTAGKRKSSGSLKASSGILTSTKKVSSEKESLESRSRRDNTPTPSQETTAMEEQDRKEASKENDDEVKGDGDDGNQRSDGAAPFELTLDLAGRQTKEGNGAPRIGDKRMSLLESLYKDIEEMEMRFEHEQTSSSSSSNNTSTGGGAASTPTPPQLPALQASRGSVNTGAPPREAKHPARAMSPLQREQKTAYPIHI